MPDDFRFLHSAHTARCTANVDKHFDGYHTLQLMTRGAIHLSYDAAEYDLAGAWFWPAMPGPLIRFHAQDDPGWWEHRYVAFQGPQVDRWSDAGILPSGPVISENPHADAERFDRLLSTVQGSRRWSRLGAINQLERLLIDLAEAQAKPDAPAWVSRAKALLADRIDEPVDHHAIASELEIGYSTFRRLFLQHAGATPHAFRIEARVARARALLAETDTPIKSIAERLGYSDVFYFARQFRAETGLPPRAYRLSAQR